MHTLLVANLARILCDLTIHQCKQERLIPNPDRKDNICSENCVICKHISCMALILMIYVSTVYIKDLQPEGVFLSI